MIAEDRHGRAKQVAKDQQAHFSCRSSLVLSENVGVAAQAAMS